MWWFSMLASSGMCVTLGMWGCRYRELQPVFFGGGRILGSNAAPRPAADDEDDDDDDEAGGGDEEMGLAKGRGRQRSGGREEYEMGQVQSGR